MPIDVRMGTEITAEVALPAEQKVWLKANGPLPADPRIHLALMVYASDRCLLDTAFRPHVGEGEITGASLDHSMWFHAPPRFDDWLLYHTLSPVAGQGRGLANGALYDTGGNCLATVAQEGSVRFR
jgi:acyl-CoA thioesterase-2